MRGANVKQAAADRTVFAGVDLRDVKGLESIRHFGPSEISTSAISQSEGRIPEVFLRGCGLRDWEIEATKLYCTNLSQDQVIDLTYKVVELRTDPLIQFHSCFISYSSKDEKFAQQLYTDLQDGGVRCWFAPEKLKIGDKFRDKIEESIHLHDKLLLILSVSSVSSDWVKDEVEAALERERREKRSVLFPIQIDDAVETSTKSWAAAIRRTHHIGDFRRQEISIEYRKGFARLLQDLRMYY